MEKILIIEDEENIRELIRYNLSAEGYECFEVADGAQALEMVKEVSPDLILLDIMLPNKNGFEICKDIRMEEIETPIIMLTAKNEEVDKVLGLEFGADDYLTKPFGIRELKARIKAVLRRYNKEEKSDLITIENITIDVPSHEVKVGGELIELTFKEFELLAKLASNKGRVFTREQLLDSVWGYEYSGETRTVDVHVRNLRKKLGGDENQYIKTVRGVGYKI